MSLNVIAKTTVCYQTFTKPIEEFWNYKLYNPHNFVHTWLFLTNLVPLKSPVQDLSNSAKFVKNGPLLA